MQPRVSFFYISCTILVQFNQGNPIARLFPFDISLSRNLEVSISYLLFLLSFSRSAFFSCIRPILADRKTPLRRPLPIRMVTHLRLFPAISFWCLILKKVVT